MATGYSILPDSHGYTSTIYLLPGSPHLVCKSFNSDCITTHFPVEKAAYERFSAHNHNRPSSILNYHGVHLDLPAGIILDLASNGTLYKYRWDQQQLNNPTPSPEVLFRWARQIVQALEFAHFLGVYHSDIHPVNFFLDRDMSLKVGDWAGASIDGSISQSSYRLRHRLFDADGRDMPRATGISVRTEVFALGTALYFMVAGHDPWPELREPEDREEIKRRIAGREFPDTSDLAVLGGVILRCWHVRFTSMTEVKDAIGTERKLRMEGGDGEEAVPMANGA